MSLAPTVDESAPAHALAGFGLDMLARGAARLRGDRIAIAEAGDGADEAPVAYRDLDRLALAFSALAAESGLSPGERILILGAARVGAAVALLGALACGLEPVVAPMRPDTATLAFLAQSSGAAAVFGPMRYGAFDAEAAMLDIAAAAPGVRLVGSLGPGAGDGAVDFSPRRLRDAGDAPVRPLKPGDGPRIGLALASRDRRTPRTIFVPQADIVGHALDLASRLRLSAERPILCALSPASLGGIVAGAAAALLAGAPLTWFGPFDAAAFVATLDRLGPCHLIAPAAAARDIARAGLTRNGALESLVLSQSAGDDMSLADIDAACMVASLSVAEDGDLSISTRPALATGGSAAHSP